MRAGGTTTGSPRSRLFTVRVWAEVVGSTTEQRGLVRDVESGAFCSFRQWSDLSAFLAAQVEEGQEHSQFGATTNRPATVREDER
jgi:hypothetical protein